MTDLRTYSGWITAASAAVARKMGINVAGSSKEARVQARITIGLIAGLVKLLVDKGVLTDAEVQALLGGYGGDTYAPEPAEPQLPDPTRPDDETNTPGAP
jgi:hypothetical protein